MQYLRKKLHLEQLLEQEPMVLELGRNVRNFLIKPFEESKKARRPGSGDEEGEEGEDRSSLRSRGTITRQKLVSR
jgi:hypothetical protein